MEEDTPTRPSGIFLVIADPDYQICSLPGYSLMHWTRDMTIDRIYSRHQLLAISRCVVEAFIDRRHMMVAELLTVNDLINPEYDVYTQISEALQSSEDILECILIRLIDEANRWFKAHPKLFKYENNALTILLNKLLDVDRQLINRLWNLHISDEILCQDDNEYRLDGVGQLHCCIDETRERCYYPSQESAAKMLMRRIIFILQHYHGGKDLTHFEDFDFRIYTARSNMLEEQTVNRLCAKEAQCFEHGSYEQYSTLRELAKKHVWKYQKTDATMADLTQFKKDASENPNKFFLVVADEAHWGITNKGLMGELGANHELINAWDHDKYPNVFVLLVSATPWNLLTENSRIPLIYVAEKLNDGKFLVVEEYRQRLFTADKKDVTSEVGQKKELHVMKWSESHEDRLINGWLVVLRTPQKKEAPKMWLTIKNASNEFGLYSFVGTADEREASQFLLKRTPNGYVSIMNNDESLVLVAEKRGSTEILGFAPRATKINELSSSNRFKLIMDFGEDIFEFQSCLKELGMCQLEFDESSRQVKLGRKPAENRLENNINIVYHSKQYLFVVDSHHVVGQSQLEKQYLSLNFYYDTIRNFNSRDKLIRHDTFFEQMLNELRTPDQILADHILAAEYAYYILLINPIRNARIGTALLSNFFRDPLTAWKRYLTEKDANIKAMVKELEKGADSPFEAIKPSLFNKVVEHLEFMAWTSLKESCTNVANKRNSENNAKKFSDSFVFYLFNSNERLFSERMADIKTLLGANLDVLELKLSNLHKLLLDRKVTLTEQSETFRIIDDLYNESPQTSEIDGHMKVVRVADCCCGNRFYATTVLARKIGHQSASDFQFEIIR